VAALYHMAFCLLPNWRLKWERKKPCRERIAEDFGAISPGQRPSSKPLTRGTRKCSKELNAFVEVMRKNRFDLCTPEALELWVSDISELKKRLSLEQRARALTEQYFSASAGVGIRVSNELRSLALELGAERQYILLGGPEKETAMRAWENPAQTHEHKARRS